MFCPKQSKSELGKFDFKVDEAICFSYSLMSKTYRVLNRKTLNVKESIHVFYEIVDLKKNPFKLNKSNACDEEYLNDILDEMYLNENPPS